MFGVSPDSLAAHRKFAEKQRLAVTLLSDPDHQVLAAYQAWGAKKMYGKDYEGVLRSTVLIDPQGIVLRHWPSVKAKGHAAEVLAALKAAKQ